MPCEAGGTDDGKFYPGEAAQIMASVSDKLEALWKGRLKPGCGFLAESTRRYGTVVRSDWRGCQSRRSTPDAPEPRHEIVIIGGGCRFTPAKSGYFTLTPTMRGKCMITIVAASPDDFPLSAIERRACRYPRTGLAESQYLSLLLMPSAIVAELIIRRRI